MDDRNPMQMRMGTPTSELRPKTFLTTAARVPTRVVACGHWPFAKPELDLQDRRMNE